MSAIICIIVGVLECALAIKGEVLDFYRIIGTSRGDLLYKLLKIRSSSTQISVNGFGGV